MNVFELMSAHDYGELHFGLDEDTGLHAVVALHDTRLGPAIGGSRFITYTNEQAAVIDALRLARAMTHKAALARLPHGGGKAVIMRPEREFDRAALLRSFARMVDGLGGRYITTEDSGTSPADMEIVRSVTDHVCGFAKDSGGSGDPSPFTALGVRRGIEACVQHKLGRSDLEGLRVAVQGVGNVGYNLCKELSALGAELTVADVRDSLTEKVADELGAEVAPSAAIHRQQCDVYAPCALGGAINDRTVPELRCAIVAGAANNQLAEDRNGGALRERGILYAPDYAINAGGLINVAQEVKGYDADAARERTLKVFDTILEICQRADKEQRPTHEIADALVREILSQAGARFSTAPPSKV
jgi:leucine dehydrogenase